MTMFLIMSFKKFIWVSEQPPRADTSALAAIMDFKKLTWIPVGADLSRPAPMYRPLVDVRYPDEKVKTHNRALHSVARLFCESFLSGRAQSVKFVLQDSGGNSDGYS